MDEKRRRFRFRLRTLLIGVTLAGVFFAFGAPVVRKWQRELANRNNIHQLGLAIRSGGGIRVRGFTTLADWLSNNSRPAKKLP
jgi:hypothetical protein